MLEDLLIRVGASTAGLAGLPGQIARTMSQVRRSIEAAAGDVTISISAPAAALGAGILDAALDFERLRLGILAVAGSSNEAEEQLARLRVVARAPGLGFEEAIAGSTRLQAAGLSAQMAERSLAAFGNALATVGGSRAELQGVVVALGQIAATPFVQGDEIRQLQERLPQIRQMMIQAFGTGNTEQLKAMGVSSEEFIQRIVEAFEELPMVNAGVQNTLDNLYDTVRVSFDKIGQAALPGIARMADTLIPIIERAADAFGQLDPYIQQAILGFLGLAAVAGPAMLLFSAMNPVVLGVVAAAALLSAGVSYLVENFESIHKAVQAGLSEMSGLASIWEGVRDLVIAVVDEIMAVVTAWVGVFQGFWEIHGEQIILIAKTAWGAVVTIIETALDVLTGIVKFFGSVLSGDWRGAFLAIYEITRDFMEGLTNLVAHGVALILDTFANMERGLGPIGDSIANYLAGLADDIRGEIARIEAAGPIILPGIRTGVSKLPREAGGAEEPPDRPTGGDFTRTPRVPRQRRPAMTDAQRSAQEIMETLRDLPMLLAAADSQAGAFNTQMGLAGEKADIIRAAIETLTENGLARADSRVQGLITQYEHWNREAMQAEMSAAVYADNMEKAGRAMEILDVAAADIRTARMEATLLGTQMQIPGQEAQAYSRALQEALRLGLDPAGAVIQGIVSKLKEARDAAAQASAAMQLMEGQRAASVAGEQADAYFVATGDTAGYAAARVAALQQQFDSLAAAGGPVTDELRGMWAELENARRFEEVANSVGQAFQDIRGAVLGFGVDAVQAFVMAAAGTQTLSEGITQAAGALIGGVFESLGNVLIQTGMTALGVGAGIKAIVESLVTLNPFVALAAGAALLALGGAVKASLGSVSRGGNSSVGRGPNFVLGPTYFPGGGEDNPIVDAVTDLRREVQGLRGDVRNAPPPVINVNPREAWQLQIEAERFSGQTTVGI
jgi:tape measure domain-containing protein